MRQRFDPEMAENGRRPTVASVGGAENYFGDLRQLATKALVDDSDSKLAGADEERTLARLRALHSDLMDPTIALHHGRVVKRTGDGMLITENTGRAHRTFRAFCSPPPSLRRVHGLRVVVAALAL